MKRNKQFMKYVVNGGITTFVNYVVYFGLLKFNVNYLVANTIAWLIAVFVAYYTNRKWVFDSTQSLTRELTAFLSLRATTLCVENVLLYVFIQSLGIQAQIAKIVVSLITVIANYAICKSKIFRKGEFNHG